MSSSAQENVEEQNDTEKASDEFEQSDRSSSAGHVPNSNTEDNEPQKRKRKWSEKGKDYFSEIRGKTRQSAYSALSQQISRIYQLLDENLASITTLEVERDRLDSLKDLFNGAQNAFAELIDNDEDKQESYDWFDIRDRECIEARTRLVEKIHALERMRSKPARTSSIKSGYSRRSEKSIASGKTSSSRSIKFQAAARTGRFLIRTEMEFFERDNEMRRNQLLKDIAIAGAEERAIKEALENERQEEIKQNTSIKLDPSVPSFVPKLPPLQQQDTREKGEKLDKKSTAPTREKTDTAIKEEKSALTNSPPARATDQTETIETKPSVTQIYPRDNSTAQQPRTQQRGNSAVKQEINSANSQPVLPVPTTIYRESSSQETLRELINLQAKQAETRLLLVEQQKRNGLPAKEPPAFSGNAFDYPAFTTAFDSIISGNVQSNRDRLYFLDKYTVGKANENVKGFLAVNSEEAYTEARKLLDQRFGNLVHVAEAYKSRLRNWPQNKDGDSAGLQAFSDFLFRCQEAVKISGSKGELDSSQMIIQVSAKLPSYSGVKWCRHAYEARTKSGSSMSFSELVQFVKGESDLANDPVFSPDALRRERRSHETTKEYKGKTRNKADSFATSTGQEQYQATKCPLCEKTHALDKCHEFKKKKLEDRREFIESKGLCFGCLKSGHLSISCQSRLACEECGKPHPTLLHSSLPPKRPQRRIKPKNSDKKVEKSAEVATGNPPNAPGNESTKTKESTCGSTTSIDAETTTSMIVPLLVHHKDRPSVEVSVYALLDDGSDSTFVTKSTLRDLGLKGTEVSLKLNTMHGENSIPAQKVEGLVVQRLGKDAVVELPKAYSREAIPARRNQIPTPEIDSKWCHLEKIKDKIPPIQNNVEVGLLIGCN